MTKVMYRSNAQWVLGVLLASAACSAGLASTPPSFQPTVKMLEPRSGHIATLLLDGRVLVAGGTNGHGELKTAELFDPQTNTFTATGPMNWKRWSPAAARLKDGRVLLIGGGAPGVVTNAAELFDPTTGQFKPASGLINGRFGHTADLLENGRVLVAGGWGKGGPLRSAELFDPAMGEFVPTGSLVHGRYLHSSVALPDGRVALLGGIGTPANVEPAIASVEIYDPKTRTFTDAGQLVQARADAGAALLADGRILIAGGLTTDARGNNVKALDTVEIYDPMTGQSAITDHLSSPRDGATVLALPDGQVLIAGGQRTYLHPTAADQLTSADLVDGVTGKVTSTLSMSGPRVWGVGTLLPDGRVLLTGGVDGAHYLDTAEVYLPAH